LIEIELPDFLLFDTRKDFKNHFRFLLKLFKKKFIFVQMSKLFRKKLNKKLALIPRSLLSKTQAASLHLLLDNQIFRLEMYINIYIYILSWNGLCKFDKASYIRLFWFIADQSHCVKSSSKTMENIIGDSGEFDDFIFLILVQKEKKPYAV